jgi:hypothetical protein
MKVSSGWTWPAGHNDARTSDKNAAAESSVIGTWLQSSSYGRRWYARSRTIDGRTIRPTAAELRDPPVRAQQVARSIARRRPGTVLAQASLIDAIPNSPIGKHSPRTCTSQAARETLHVHACVITATQSRALRACDQGGRRTCVRRFHTRQPAHSSISSFSTEDFNGGHERLRGTGQAQCEERWRLCTEPRRTAPGLSHASQVCRDARQCRRTPFTARKYRSKRSHSYKE